MQRMSPRSSTACAAWLVALCLVAASVTGLACHAPIRTVEVGPEQTYRDLNENVLNAGVLSADTRAVLVRFDLEQAYEDDPHDAIRRLHAIAVELPARALLYSLAELCYAAGEHGYGQDDYLASTVYAYLFLFGSESDTEANPYDRRFRVACDLYNYGLLKALRSPDGKQFLPRSGTHALPVGRLELRTTLPELDWFDETFERFVPADNLRVIGLSSRRRDAGLGVPLIGVVTHAGGANRAVRLPPRASVPMTAILRLGGGLAELEGSSSATLEFHSAFDVPATTFGGHTVRLEADLSAPLAYQLGASSLWRAELGAFFSSDKWRGGAGIWMQQPYQRGKIPVVFVHGTASSPARWAEMFSQLNADADLRSAFQFWFFTYTTGNPIPYSASLLRDGLTDVLQELDPAGRDASLRNVVVIGHSQGGLLAKMLAIDTGETFWNQVVEDSQFPIDRLSDEERQLLRRALVFEPQPAVKRVVYIATPQHGSFVAGRWIGRFLARLVGTPAHLKEMFTSAFSSPDLVKRLGREFPTSVDNMKPDHPFVQALASIDVAAGIHSHSIIPVDGAGPPEDLDDGVVAYKSAHLESVDSEFIVRSGHSCQDNPNTIQEVRRILLEHLRQSGK